MFLDRLMARTVLLSLAGIAVWGTARADTPTVPLQLQVELCNKVIEYVQEPAVLSLDRIRIGIVVKTGSPESMRAGAELKAAFDRAVIANGHAHEQSIIEWSNAKALAEQARTQEPDACSISRPASTPRSAPAPRPWSASGSSPLAPSTRSSRQVSSWDSSWSRAIPKMILNLRQAKKQEIVLRAAIIKLMRIVE